MTKYYTNALILLTVRIYEIPERCFNLTVKVEKCTGQGLGTPPTTGQLNTKHV